MSNQSNQPSVTTTMIALYGFDAEDEPEISMKKGDQIEILDMDPALNGWAYARKKRDGTEGYVPISYLGTSNNSRSHKHSKSQNQSRSSSPNSNKGRYDDKNSGNTSNNYNRGYQHNRSGGGGNYHNHNNQNAPNQHGNNQNNHNQNQQNDQQHQQHQQHQNMNNNPNVSNQQNVNQQNKGNQNNQQQGQNDNVPDAKQIICSFHRDFIPDMNDLYKYFGEFGKITNKLEIEYDSKKVPLAKIKFQSASCVEKVCEKGNRQQIPSGSQNGTIHIRVYRSMQDYINNTQQRNRGPYNKHKRSGRGGF